MGRKVDRKKSKEQFLYERKKQLEIMESISSICKGCDIYNELKKTKSRKEVANTCAKGCNLINSLQEETKIFLETLR
ncbi:hypothetical protein [Bacillus toyonensis]|uniref:hypothetical protein n=1 Tax=Bacillus toyonensis TaxID=155322 RepID=UPI001908E003|nr:hypothetical protein [Bacillus toyonensis]QQN86428.1 hypothetical protein I0K03_28645 [Bacillus toyonensis]